MELEESKVAETRIVGSVAVEKNKRKRREEDLIIFFFRKETEVVKNKLF